MEGKKKEEEGKGGRVEAGGRARSKYEIKT